ncbi:MAG: DedA family protein [Chloroflexi bacterium]|nr:DedA family protein [Chloroflexota bacterium]
MHQVETLLLDFVQGVYNAVGWPGVVLMMAIESACIPLPSELIMPLAGWFLISDRGLGAEWVFLLALLGALGNLLGSLAAYYAGAIGGRPFLERYGKYLLVSRHDLDFADRWFRRHGEATAFVSRLLPVVRTFISLPAGIARMNVVKFSIFTFLGAYPFSLALAYGGYLLGEKWERVRDLVRPFELPIIAVIVAFAVWYVWRHYKRAWRPDQAPTETGE